jgi:hypothetical protein
MAVSTIFSGKKIVVFSPQPWNDLLISKHHYARELARNNEVYFICAPEVGIGFSFEIRKEQGVNVIDYKLPLPEKLKFHANGFYKWVNQQVVKHNFNKAGLSFDICIDFGAYALYDNFSFLKPSIGIFFPVDDFEALKPTTRGADFVFSVSDIIVKKFVDEGVDCHFINHGLSSDFAEVAKQRLSEEVVYKKGEPVKVAYAGNLFIKFLHFGVFKELIQRNRDIEFHLFGGTRFNAADPQLVDWDKFLKSSSNVKVHGFTQPVELAKALGSMDACLLCYKPDYKNYHGENSHKIFEYMSSGKLLISAHISLYKNSTLMVMSPKDKEEELIGLFSDAIANLADHNSKEKSSERIKLALDNTYARQIERINEIIATKTSMAS